MSFSCLPCKERVPLCSVPTGEWNCKSETPPRRNRRYTATVDREETRGLASVLLFNSDDRIIPRWMWVIVLCCHTYPMKVTFRQEKKAKYLGMVLTATFFVAVVGSACIFFIEEPAKHGFKGELSVVVVGGCSIALYGTMLLLSIYAWAAYYVERFTVEGTMLSIRSMFQDCQFDASELECVKWKVYPRGGRLRFRVLGSKARLDLQGYSKDDRLRIIRALHDLVPPGLQEGWPMFCHKVALPLRDGKPSTVSIEPSAKHLTICRRRYDVMLLPSLLIAVAIAIALWAWLDRWQFIVLPFLVIAAWLLLRFSVPNEGRADVQLTSTLLGRAQLVGWGAVVTSQLLMIGLAVLGFRKTAIWAAIVIVVAAFPPVFYFLHKSDKERRTADAQGAESAPTRWQQGETSAAKAVAENVP